MYQIIENIIAHTWQSNYSNDQQYLYYITGAVLCILVVALIDAVKSIFAGFIRRK